MFRNLIFLAMAVGAATMAGWLSIDREGDQATIHLNRAEIRSDTSRIIDRGRELLDERGRMAREPQSNFGRANENFSQQSYPAPASDRQYQYPTDQYQASTYQTNRYPTQQIPAQQNPATENSYDQYGQAQYREAGYQRPQGVYRGQANPTYQNDQNR